MCNFVNNILSQLDFSNRDVDYRISKVNEILYDKNGYLKDDVIDCLDNIKVDLTQQDKLVSDNKIVRMFERMADYILYVDTANKKRDITYRFFTYKKLIQKAVAEKKSIGMVMKELYYNYASKLGKNEIVYIKYDCNYLKVKKQKLVKKDFELMPILKVYENLKDKIRKELNNIDKDELADKKRKATLRGLFGGIVADQLLAKDAILGTIYFKNVNNINLQDNSYVQMNYCDKNNILELLKYESNMLSDIGCIAYDLNVIISKLKWSDLELKVMELYKLDKKYVEIAYELGLPYKKIIYTVNKICQKIMKTYNKSYSKYILKK